MDNCNNEEKSVDTRTRSEAAKNMERFLKSINATDKTAERMGKTGFLFKPLQS